MKRPRGSRLGGNRRPPAMPATQWPTARLSWWEVKEHTHQIARRKCVGAFEHRRGRIHLPFPRTFLCFAHLITRVPRPVGSGGNGLSMTQPRDQKPPAEGRRGFMKKLLAGIIGAVLGLVPVGAGLTVFLDPLRRKTASDNAV